MFRIAIGLVALSLLLSCATTSQVPLLPAELAPSGKLRAAINFSNPILAVKDQLPASHVACRSICRGSLRGVSAFRIELVTYDARQGSRRLEGRRLESSRTSQSIRHVKSTSALPSVCRDRGGLPCAAKLSDSAATTTSIAPVHVVVGAERYDLFLTRNLKQAKIVRAQPLRPSPICSSRRLEVAAGVKQQLEADARRIPACACSTDASW